MAARPEDLGSHEPAHRSGARPASAALDVVVAPMRRRHLRSVLRIEHQVYPRPWSIGLYVSELALGPSRIYLVARVDSSVVGYAGLMVIHDEGHVTTVAVDPAWHRRHVAVRLMLQMVRQAIQRDVKALTLEVRMSNTAAQGMYQRFGFVPAGARKGYYIDNQEDALVMWAHDIDTDAYTARLAAIEASISGRTALEGFR